MCGRYELTTEFKNLPVLLKKDLPEGFNRNYEKQTLIVLQILRSTKHQNERFIRGK